jgi:hypothetical protein
MLARPVASDAIDKVRSEAGKVARLEAREHLGYQPFLG